MSTRRRHANALDRHLEITRMAIRLIAGKKSKTLVDFEPEQEDPEDN